MHCILSGNELCDTTYYYCLFDEKTFSYATFSIVIYRK